ncbi:MAG: hypothetical protein M3R38_34820, partial [Actinomycetota bacterium]|nr:hypothetical protein [Actinomycetota bacterium]
MSALDRVQKRLNNMRVEGEGYKASCPLPTHGQGRGDRDPSLSVATDAEGNVLLKCFAGCENEAVVEALGLKMVDLFEHRNGSGYVREGGGGSHTPPKSRSTHQPSDPATLENYAAYVRLPVEFLKDLGLAQIHYGGEPAVRMPYPDGSGEEVLLTRFRVSLTGKPKVKTKRGDKHRLYGLWKLEEARAAGYAFLIEGESDCQTLWFHGEPGVGIPGANGWKQEWASDLEGISRLYFVVEDEAGEACWEKLAATPEIRERLYRVELEGAKDVSELHKQDPEGFSRRLAEARAEARAWLDIAETEDQERARDSWALCRELAESPDILAEFVKDLERCRLVGETRNAKLLYLALTSRILEKIVSVAVKGPSSAGKSFLVKKVLGFFPESACWSFSGMSEKTLFYTEEPLSHRHLFFAEAAGVGGEFQDYIIRTLLSEGFLEYEFVEKTADGLRPRRIRKDGPTGFITTTTRSSLFWENETRYLSLTVTDTRDQTRRVFRAISEESVEEPDLTRWRALQVWLEGSERRVSVPYARELAEKMGDVAVRLRRDFSVILSLIRAHALLHQATRERDGDGRVVASVEDYARVRELVADLVAEGVEATVPTIVRETVEAVERLIRDGDEEHATNRSVAEDLRIDKSAASRRVRVAVDRGYLRNLEDRKGRPARLVLGESMPEDAEILPLPE